jgi:hypothetical protein
MTCIELELAAWKLGSWRVAEGWGTIVGSACISGRDKTASLSASREQATVWCLPSILPVILLSPPFNPYTNVLALKTDDQRHHDMNTRATIPTSHQIYPKRYFDASPTWFQWNRLRATDVHSLREERGFEGQNIYFCLNHPIRFVRLVGLIVDINLVADKYLILALDDSSGACIEVKTELRSVREDDHAEYPSNTVVDNVDAVVDWGVPSLYINKEPADIGTVVKVKGTIHTFRKTRQLRLERAWIVKDTNEEAKAWAETAQWRRDVLSKPWTLTAAQRAEIDEDINRELAKEREKMRKRRALDSQSAEKKRLRGEKAEARRRREAEKFDAGALVGSFYVPLRVTDS